MTLVEKLDSIPPYERYKNQVITVYSGIRRIGFITRQATLTGESDFGFFWSASPSIITPKWEGLFKTRQEARKFLENKVLN